MNRILIIVALLTADLSAWGQKVASLDDQAKCAEQAEKVFKSEVQLLGSNPDAEAGFTSHYNPKLGMCVVRIGKGVRFNTNEVKVEDAFENVIVAWYVGSPYVDHPTPALCEISNSKFRCSSLDEFNDVVEKVYGVKP